MGNREELMGNKLMHCPLLVSYYCNMLEQVTLHSQA
jgi:hypothetical protein